MGKAFKGAYYVHSPGKIKVEIKIFDPKGKTILNSQEMEGVIDLNLTFAGTHQLLIFNKEVFCYIKEIL